MHDFQASPCDYEHTSITGSGSDSPAGGGAGAAAAAPAPAPAAGVAVRRYWIVWRRFGLRIVVASAAVV